MSKTISTEGCWADDDEGDEPEEKAEDSCSFWSEEVGSFCEVRLQIRYCRSSILDKLDNLNKDKKSDIYEYEYEYEKNTQGQRQRQRKMMMKEMSQKRRQTIPVFFGVRAMVAMVIMSE